MSEKRFGFRVASELLRGAAIHLLGPHQKLKQSRKISLRSSLSKEREMRNVTFILLHLFLYEYDKNRNCILMFKKQEQNVFISCKIELVRNAK